MIFSNVTGPDGLIQECERICRLGAGGISGNAQYLKDFTSRMNNGIDRFFALVEMYDVNWNLDDRRYADDNLKLPVACTDIKNGVGDYLLDSKFLAITQVFVKDANGNFNQLIEQDDKRDPEAYLLKQPNGTPTHFKFVGNSIILTPKPNYDSTAGLKLTYKRNGQKFTVADGAVTPGIPVLFHPYLARYASYPFLVEKDLKNAQMVLKQIGSADSRDPLYGGDEAAIATFVSNRAKPKTAGLKPGGQNNK